MSESIYKGPSGVVYGGPLETEISVMTAQDAKFLVIAQDNAERGEDEPDLVVLDEATVDIILAHFNPNKEPACADH